MQRGKDWDSISHFNKLLKRETSVGWINIKSLSTFKLEFTYHLQGSFYPPLAQYWTRQYSSSLAHIHSLSFLHLYFVPSTIVSYKEPRDIRYPKGLLCIVLKEDIISHKQKQ